jgi:hypothetical protein
MTFKKSRPFLPGIWVLKILGKLLGIKKEVSLKKKEKQVFRNFT